MYLSRLELNPANPNVQKDISDCHAMHRTVLSAFPSLTGINEKAREHYGVLFRVDTSRDGRLLLLVQSNSQPDWTQLKSGYLASCDLPNPACRELGSAYGKLSKGILLAFTLKSNPTKKVGTSLKEERLYGDKRCNGKRIFINTRDAQLEWLGRKAHENGFILHSVSAKESTVWGKKQKITNLRFDGVTFQGYLRVTDAELFLRALRFGIGPGKAYGFGLLSIAPAGGKT